MASSPYVTAVGGTDFTWSFVDTPYTNYWNTSNNADLSTAKGYLPEVPWNSTCANPLMLNVFPSETSTESLCNDAYSDPTFYTLAKISAGSGGYSHCTTPSGTTSSTCSGGYAKPSWQTGTGVPADGKRDLPDVSLFASAGFGSVINGSAILFCYAESSPEATCDYTNPDYVIYQEIGGTSASSPLMAGIMALIVQKTGSAQGLANPVLYKLYASQVAAGTACDSSTDTNASTCVFHDISQGTISQICVSGDPNCVTETSGDQFGLLAGYAATKGYDEAVGLGSLNVNNLVKNWISTAGSPAITLSPTSATFPSTIVGSTSATTATFTAKNTGTAPVTFTNIEITGTSYTSYSGSSTCSTTSSLAVGASCTVTVSFKPTATGTLTATLNIVDNAGTQSASLSGTGAAASTYTLSLSPAALTFASTTVGSTTAAQVITIKNTGTAAVTLTSETITGANATSFVKSATTCGTSLAAAASCTVSVEFKPAAAGSLTGSLSIADNATGSPQLVSLQGTATAPSTPTVTLSPASIAFPTTIIGTTSDEQIVSLTNTGSTAVTITSFALGGSNPTSFEQLTTCGSTLAASASCSFYVAFKPSATGALTATLNVADTASGSPQKVTLTGTGAPAPSVKLSATSLSFPTTKSGSTSAAQSISLTNSGTAAINLTSISLAGTNPTSFQEVTNCGATLAAGASCTVYIAFSPTSTGALKATLSVVDNGASSPQSVALSGTGD
jgi:subtilase family serine protease